MVRVVAATDQPETAHSSSTPSAASAPTRAARGRLPGAARPPTRACGWRCCWSRRKILPPNCSCNSAAEAHLSEPLPGQPRPQPATLRQWARREKFQQEEALREGRPAIHRARAARRPGRNCPGRREKAAPPARRRRPARLPAQPQHLLRRQPLLREMATWLRDHGYEYLGICDHCRPRTTPTASAPSGCASSTGNRPAERRAGARSASSKASKATFSATARLDYPPDVLASFDFVVASRALQPENGRAQSHRPPAARH